MEKSKLFLWRQWRLIAFVLWTKYLCYRQQFVIFWLAGEQSVHGIQGETKKKCLNVFISALIQDIEMKSMDFESGLWRPRCDARHRENTTHGTSYAFLERWLGCHRGPCRAFTWHKVEHLDGRMDSQVCPFILLSDVLMCSFISFLNNCFLAQHRQCIIVKIHLFKMDFYRIGPLLKSLYTPAQYEKNLRVFQWLPAAFHFPHYGTWTASSFVFIFQPSSLKMAK